MIEKLAAKVPSKGKIVEIGSFCGRSSWAWAKSCDPSVTVYCLDIWPLPNERPFTSDAGFASLMKGNLTNDDFINFSPHHEFLRRTQDCPNIVPMRGESPKDFHWNQGEIDLLFIDDEHTYEQLMLNFKYWYPFLKPNGILCGDDYHTKVFPEVVKGVKEISRTLKRSYRVEGHSFWIC